MYKERFVWITHTRRVNEHCKILIHWSKSNKKDVINKSVDIAEVNGIEVREPAKGSSPTGDSGNKCWSIIHKNDVKRSLDLKAFNNNQASMWTQGLQWLKVNCEVHKDPQVPFDK